MVNNEIIKLKFDNSFNGRLFATQGDTGRVFNLQVFDDYNKPVDVTGMKLRMYVANSKEVSYSEGEIVEATEGKINVQVYNSQLKYPGKQKSQFILTDKDGQKIGSKIYDFWIEEGLEAGPTVGRNIYVDFEKINEALELIKDYDKTLEEAKEVDASLKVGINEGIEARNNLTDCKKKALEIKGQLDNSKTDANKTLDDLKATKAESESLKSSLSSENQKATSNISDLSGKIEQGETTVIDLNTSIENAKKNKSNLDNSNASALATKKSLEGVTTTANTTKTELGNLKNQGDTLSEDLTAKITDGNKLKSNLDTSINKATTAKSNLDESIINATSTNTTLKATDEEAKKTETFIKNLMSQLNLTKDEVSKIIAAGDLSKYITEPKLQEVLEDYVKKQDIKGFIYKYVKEESIKIKTMTAVIDQSNSNPLTCITYEDDAKMMEKGSAEWDKFFGAKLVLFKDGKELRDLEDAELDSLKPEDGDVMVKFKRMGLNIKTVGDKVYVSMTNDPDDENFKYYAHTRGAERKEAFYLGAYLGYEIGGKLRSVKGVMSSHDTTIGAFRTLAQANGSGYEQFAFYQLVFLQAMYILKYGNLDSQTAIGKGLTNGEFTNTGTTNGKGIDFGSTNATLQMRFQYIEDFYGNKYQWIDGVRSGGKSDMTTATDGFNDNGQNYKSYPIGFSGNVYSYSKKVQGTSELGFIIKENGASQSTYYCDYQDVYGNSARVPYFGGCCNDDSDGGADAGAFSFDCNYSASDLSFNVGSRLMFL